MATDQEVRAGPADSSHATGDEESAVDSLARQLRASWDAGQRTPLEQLLAESASALEAEDLLDLIYHEILIREDHGDSAEESEYVARFPELTARVRRIFEIHRAVESTDLDGLVADRSDSTRNASVRSAKARDRDNSDRGSSNDGGDAADGLTRRSTRASRPSAGPRIPGFEMLGEIGLGGMAIVYKARQQPLGRIVAVKVLSAGQMASREVVQRFRQEAQTIASLQHPHIVQIHEVGEFDGQPYLTLEYVDGGTLHAYLQHRPLAPLVAAELAELLARTMEYAHSMGVVHRDLKPANVLLQLTDGSDSREASSGVRRRDEQHELASANAGGLPFRPKIADFGLAKLVDMASDLTMTGHIVGTPSYMAPEQTGRAHEVGPAADIYSVGAILYELLTGHPPFQGVSSLEILDQVRSREPVSPRRLQPRVPRDLETICLKCLEKEPARRYRSAGELADDLRRVRGHEPIHARPARLWEQGWKWGRRRPAVAGLLLLLTFVSIAGISGVGWQFHAARRNARDAQDQRDHARRLHGVAVLERNEAERRRVEAEEAKTRAVESQRRAEANFDRAFMLVNKMNELAETMRTTAHQEVAGWSLLESSLGFYEGFLEERESDPHVRAAAIASLLRAGQIRTGFGQHAKSLEAVNRAIELLGPPPAAASDRVAYFRNRGTAQAIAAMNYRDLRRWREAESAFLAAIDARDTAARLAPENIEFRRLHANTILNYCTILRDRARREDASSKYFEATQLLEELVKRDPQNQDCQFEYSTALDDYGGFLREAGKLEEGESLMRRAYEIRVELVKRTPDARDYVAFQARSEHRLARCHLDRHECPQALALCQQAIDTLLGAVEKFPHNMPFQRELREALALKAEAYLVANDDPAYERALHEVTRVSTRISGLFPGDIDSAAVAAAYGVKLSSLYARMGRSDSARQEYQHVVGNLKPALLRHPNSARLHNLLAWKLVTCPFTELQDSALARELAERAVTLEPERENYWNTLGVAYDDANLPSLALDCYRRSVPPNGTPNPQHLAYLARGLAFFGRAEEAREVLAKIGDSPDVDDDTKAVIEQAKHAARLLLESPSDSPAPLSAPKTDEPETVRQ